MIGRCECRDGGCPVCHGKCKAAAELTLYRVDMEDQTGTDMCGACAADALDSGVFTTEVEDEEVDEEETMRPCGWCCAAWPQCDCASRVIPADGYADGGEPYTDEELEDMHSRCFGPDSPGVKGGA